MGGWIFLGVILIGAVLIWRAARKRSGAASIKDGPISRDLNTNYGNVMSQAHGMDQRGNFTGGI
jgi:hypothetical protein